MCEKNKIPTYPTVSRTIFYEIFGKKRLSQKNTFLEHKVEQD